MVEVDYSEGPYAPMEDRMNLNIHFSGIPKSKAREICENVAGIWDPRFYVTISLTRVEDE